MYLITISSVCQLLTLVTSIAINSLPESEQNIH